MNRDTDVLVVLDGKYANEPRGDAIDLTARELNLSPSAVRGMASRARNTTAGRIAVMEYLAANVPDDSPSERKIRDIVSRGGAAWWDHRASLSEQAVAVFASDIHFPAFSGPYLNLFYDVLSDLPNVAYVSALNDAFDFAKLSLWADRRRLRDQLFDTDLANAVRMHGVHMHALRAAAPDAQFVAVVGNHDKRVALSGTDEGTGPYTFAQFVTETAEQGVVYIDRPDFENVVRINDGLYWFHGRYVSKNRSTAAVNNYGLVKRETGAKQDFDLVYGHTHWSGTVPVPNANATVYNAGHLCARRQHYLRSAPDWSPGFVYSFFDPAGGWSRTERVTFAPGRRGLSIECRVEGKTYSVPCKTADL